MDQDETNSSDSDAENSDCEVKFFRWQSDGYQTKAQVTLPVSGVIETFRDELSVVKKHIYTKRIQFDAYNKTKNSLKKNGIVDYTESYRNKQQDEILSVYFGNTSFSIFTACAYTKSTDPYIDFGLEKTP